MARDPAFLARVADLDRGLDEAGIGNAAAPSHPRPEPVRTLTPVRSPFEELLDLERELRALKKPGREAVAASPRQQEPAFTPLEPFANTPDPRFFYHSTPHDAAAQQLLTAIRNKDRLVVLTGEPGSGKTALCRIVLEELDRRTLTSFLPDPFTSVEELLAKILVDFGVMSRADLERRPHADRRDLTRALQAFVESLAPIQASVVVVIDEAQSIPPPDLRDLVDTPLQIVLVGRPALLKTLRLKGLRDIDQQVTRRCELGPLPAEEVGGYIRHRLSAAGGQAGVDFEEAAIDRVSALSRGLPLALNVLCERALVLASGSSAANVDRALVNRAAQDLGLETPRSVFSKAAIKVAAIAGLLACLLAGAASAAWVFHDAAARVLTALHESPRSGPRR